MNPLSKDPQLVTIDTLKKLVGFTALFFPAVLILLSFLSGQCTTVQETISHYYYSVVGNVFVGALSAISVFLIVYKGYPDSKDNLATSIAGVFALGVALLPTSVPCDTSSCVVVNLEGIMDVSVPHYVSAALMFITLAYVSIVLFRKKGANPTPQKIFRNKIYLWCGIVMILAILAILIVSMRATEEWLCQTKAVLILEWVALFAFGTSWMIKGGFLFKDK
ncbi:hypothetical protein [Ekhidna sp.]|uniref:hypothetical protein n=1 Tax=Ekhidna sp. TaxID=2608089 RepID=UPI003BAB5B24